MCANEGGVDCDICNYAGVLPMSNRNRLMEAHLVSCQISIGADDSETLAIFKAFCMCVCVCACVCACVCVCVRACTCALQLLFVVQCTCSMTLMLEYVCC